MPDIHPTAVVDPHAALADNVVVGAHSVIGPHVAIGPGCRIRGARISNSVVLEHSLIRGFGGGLCDSLIAAHCELESNGCRTASGLVLGDYSAITLS